MAHNTPIAQNSLLDDLGLEGLTDKAKAVAEGDCEPPMNVHQDHVKWLNHMEKLPKAEADKT